jgi:hypothetical protein
MATDLTDNAHRRGKRPVHGLNLAPCVEHLNKRLRMVKTTLCGVTGIATLPDAEFSKELFSKMMDVKNIIDTLVAVYKQRGAFYERESAWRYRQRLTAQTTVR